MTNIADELAMYDEGGTLEMEQCGLSFKLPFFEELPKTKRTEIRHKEKLEKLILKKQQAEAAVKQKEEAAANKRREEQQAKQRMAERERARKAAAARKAEEEEQKKKMDGGLDQILDSLTNSTSAPHITFCGIKLTSIRIRLLCKAMENNVTCISLDLNRKGLNDEDGVALADMLETNQYLQKLEVEGNNLGVMAAKRIGEVLRKNTSLRCLNIESNNLTASGNEQMGMIELANSLTENRKLRVLMLSKNGIAFEAGACFEKAIEVNENLTLVDLSGSDPTFRIEQLRNIDKFVQRNRERQSAIRRAERRERFSLYNEEFKCRQHCMQVEAMRLEIEAHEERRLNRMKARFEKWVSEVGEKSEEEKVKFEDLMTEAQDRAADNKGKKKKKGK